MAETHPIRNSVIACVLAGIILKLLDVYSPKVRDFLSQNGPDLLNKLGLNVTLPVWAVHVLAFILVLLIIWFLLLIISALLSARQASTIRDLLVSRRYRLVLNPGMNRSKPIAFLANGDIGEGRNENEHSWRIRKAKLELITIDGSVHSRFVYSRRKDTFEHTNDPDTDSIRGQYIEPMFVSHRRTNN